MLVSIAGVLAVQERTHGGGQELQFSTNHLDHCTLTLGLRGRLAAGVADAGGARVVHVSLSAHLRSPVALKDLAYRFRAYDPAAAYGHSKTASCCNFGGSAATRLPGT